MKTARIISIQCLIVLFLAGCEMLSGPARPRPTPTPTADVPQEYRLGTGDIVSVRVYGGDEDIRLERVRLDAEGTLIMPFGDYKAHGRTTREIEATITDSIRGRLLKNPRVSVSIDEYRPFFVDGQVGRPGAYPYQPGLTVRKAITVAGGLRERASLKKIFVLRENDRTNTPVNVDLNTPVGPGDTIDVEESLF